MHLAHLLQSSRMFCAPARAGLNVIAHPLDQVALRPVDRHQQRLTVQLPPM